MMKTAESSELLERVLKKLYKVNTNKLLAAQKYSKNNLLLHELLKQIDAGEWFWDTQSKDMLRLQQIIKNKNKVITRYAKKLEELNEASNTYNVQRTK